MDELKDRETPSQEAGGSIRQKSGRNIIHGKQKAGTDITQEADGDITYQSSREG